MPWNKNLVDYRQVPKVKHDGFTFGSKLEKSLYDLLRLMERAGEIKDLKCQDHVYLTRARYHCIPDFRAFEVRRGYHVWYEAKGFEQERFLITKKLWSVYGPGPLVIFKGDWSKNKEIFPSDFKTR